MEILKGNHEKFDFSNLEESHELFNSDFKNELGRWKLGENLLISIPRFLKCCYAGHCARLLAGEHNDPRSNTLKSEALKMKHNNVNLRMWT